MAAIEGEPRSIGIAMPMQGFDAEFTDIVDYILRITYRIWEGKQPELCYDYYSADCPVYTLAGYTEGADAVTENTRRTLQSFPDRQLFAENIIWGGDDQRGYHSSHLIRTTMTNTGASEFGPATGRAVEIFVIAHCVCRENRIVEEWLVRDNLSLVRQLGLDTQAHVKALASQPLESGSRYSDWLDSEKQRVSSGISMRDTTETLKADEQGILAALGKLWNQRALETIDTLYASDACLHASARPDFSGRAAIHDFYQSLFANLEQPRVSFDYLCSDSMNDADPHVAVRWTLCGTHSGDSLWGPATGEQLLILGESHYRLQAGQVVEEWLVFDELAVLVQCERARRS